MEQKDKEVALLTEELEFAKTYMDLLKIRFEDAVVFDFSDDFLSQEFKILPLSLQLLLENAVKHNIVSNSKPLHISNIEKDGYLVISNTLNKKSTVASSTQVGLRNIVDRYTLLTDRQVVVENTTDKFIVKLPLLIKKQTIMKPTFDEQDSSLKARKKVDNLKEFYQNLVAYCVVIPFLIFINLYTSPQYHWFWFPLFGWGIGLAIRGFKVLGYDALLGENWEERKIKEYMQQEQQIKELLFIL